MWIMLNNAFFSFVAKDCKPDEIMVRARRPGDIERVFGVAAPEFTHSDYHYRAPVKRLKVAATLAEIILSIDYSNFKDSVKDRPLHDAYLSVWHAMARLQPERPYSGRYRREPTCTDFDNAQQYLDASSAYEDAHLFFTGRLPDADDSRPRKAKVKKQKKGRKS